MGYNKSNEKMKKTLLSLAVIAMAVAFTSCGSSKGVSTNNYSNNNGGGNPFGEVYEIPCTVYDTDTDFAATGIFRGSMNQKGELLKWALQNAQEQVRMKIKHAYKGMVSNYSQTIGNNQGNDIERKVTMAGDQIIDAVVNDTRAVCQRFGAVGEDGHIECYVAIQISKVDLSEKLSSAVNDVLSEDEKMRIGFNEMKYREQMNKSFEQYKSENK